MLERMSPSTISGITATVDDDGTVTLNGTSSDVTVFVAGCDVDAGTYTFSANNPVASPAGVILRLETGTEVIGPNFNLTTVNASQTATTVKHASRWNIRVGGGTTLANFKLRPQLELGSTATPYEPYSGGVPSPSSDWPQPIITVTGHEVTGKEGRYVSLERRDFQGDLLDTTSIPLPSRGWVAGLPDDTADALTLDGAGHVVWDCKTDKTTTAATEGITGTVGVDVMSTTDQIADGVTVLYKLATPVTEDCGYIDLPSMQDCVLSIPELNTLGVRYTIGDGAEIARQWHERNESELAAATNEALGNVAPVEGDTASANYAVGGYLVHDGTLCKVTSAIATGETITLGTNVTATTVMAEILALQTQGE
jgi:hypothetical protein